MALLRQHGEGLAMSCGAKHGDGKAGIVRCSAVRGQSKDRRGVIAAA